MLLRRWHRWIALAAALFLLFIAGTGILLHLDMMRLGQEPPGAAPPPGPVAKAAPMPSNEALAAMIVQLANTTREQGEFSPKALEISLQGPAPVLVARGGMGPEAPQIKIDARTGKRIVDPPRPADYHFILQDLHAGYFMGWPGRILSILSGLSLLVLAISGLQIWWDMARRKKRPFWK